MGHIGPVDAAGSAFGTMVCGGLACLPFFRSNRIALPGLRGDEISSGAVGGTLDRGASEQFAVCFSGGAGWGLACFQRSEEEVS